MISINYCGRLVAQTVKRLPAMWETCNVGKMPWRRKWQSTPALLPGKIPWKEEPDRLQSMGSQRVGHDSDFTFTFTVVGYVMVS